MGGGGVIIVSLGSEITNMMVSWCAGFDIRHLNLSHLCFLKVNEDQYRKQQLIYDNQFRKTMFNLSSSLLPVNLLTRHIYMKYDYVLTLSVGDKLKENPYQ